MSRGGEEREERRAQGLYSLIQTPAIGICFLFENVDFLSIFSDIGGDCAGLMSCLLKYLFGMCTTVQ